MSVKRGEIYYIKSFLESNKKGRPAVVISNDANNEHSNSFQVVYLTKRTFDKELPCHVSVNNRILFYEGSFNSDMLTSTILCEHISTVCEDRISGEKVGKLDSQAMSEVDRALKIQLDLNDKRRYTRKSGRTLPPRRWNNTKYTRY